MAYHLASDNKEERGDLLDRVSARQIQFLYTTPEQLRTEFMQMVLDEYPPWLVVVDEAHCITEWRDLLPSCVQSNRDVVGRD